MAADSFSDADGVAIDGVALLARIREWALELGFGAIGVADIDLSTAEPGLAAWLEAGFHGEMGYMASHGLKRARPDELVPGTRSAMARNEYWSADHWASSAREAGWSGSVAAAIMAATVASRS